MTSRAYVIAGSEATGGAGIQADLRAFQELGVYGIGTITCIVSFDPNNDWAHRFVPIEPQVIADQIEAATACHDLDVVKIGMLGTPDTIDVVADALERHNWRHVVLDPVLICKGQEPGAALDTDKALTAQILPRASVITPNLFESRTLSGMESIDSEADLVEAAKRIHELGPRYVVAKGGVELPGPEAIDVLYDGANVVVHRAPKLGENRVSGAGCTFAAAITAELVRDSSVESAVQTAKSMVRRGITERISAHTPFDVITTVAPET